LAFALNFFRLGTNEKFILSESFKNARLNERQFIRGGVAKSRLIARSAAVAAKKAAAIKSGALGSRAEEACRIKMAQTLAVCVSPESAHQSGC